ncbi:MAG: M48 family metalloprotease [Rhodoferax sp.]
MASTDQGSHAGGAVQQGRVWRWLRPTALALVCACLPGLVVPQATLAAEPLPSNTLPHLGDGAEMSPAAERRLGDSIVRSLYRDPDYVDDPVTMAYLQSIWQPLLAASRARGELAPEVADVFAWELLLGRDRSVNAFALPGGYFGVHLGLVAVVSNRDELASVLGHELSHVTQRHIARNMAHQAAQSPWVMGAMILGILAASKSNPNSQAASAVITGGQAAAAQSQLNFSRDMEREADRIGFAVMTQAGYAPQGFVSMFEKLQQANRLNDSGGFPYLRSHPLTTERISDMQNRIGAFGGGVPQRKATSKPDFDPQMIASRAKVLANPGVDALREWQVDAQPAVLSAKPAAVQAAVLYGAAFAAFKLSDFATARTLATQLQQHLQRQGADDSLAQLLEAEMALGQGDAARAGALLATKQSDSASIWLRARVLMLSQAQIQGGNAQSLAASTERLREWVAVNPRDVMAWRLLGSACELQGRTIAAIRAQAQADALEQDWPAALGRLRAAQDLVRAGQWGTMGPDHLEAAIVDTRAREVTQLLREQALQR